MTSPLLTVVDDGETSFLTSPQFNLTNITTASDWQIQVSIALALESNYDGE